MKMQIVLAAAALAGWADPAFAAEPEETAAPSRPRPTATAPT